MVLNDLNQRTYNKFWDNNSDKAIGGRLGYELLSGLEVGGFYSRGKYDEDNHLDIDSLGADIQFKKGNMEIRHYTLR